MVNGDPGESLTWTRRPGDVGEYERGLPGLNRPGEPGERDIEI
jgi:hypothetical protein